MIFGHPALGLLARLKLKAVARHQVRRLRKPSGILFALLGLLLVGFWVTSLVIGRSMTAQAYDPTGDAHVIATQIGIFVVGTMTLFGALNHRGLYLPKEEIERLFSAPVSRADLVRYRLTTNLFRSLLAGLVFGLLSLGRLPSHGFGFAGIMVTMLTLPLLGQAASLVLGDAENRLGKLLSGRWTKVLQGLAFATLWLMIMGLVFYDRIFEVDPLGGGDLETTPLEMLSAFVDQAWVRALVLPTKPWALLVTASDWATFGTWLAICAVVWLLLFEGTARIPIDYRELSLETSADVAKRLNRMSKGGFGAGIGKASKRTAGWEVPWIFGRGRFGAVCWLKLGSILRKARGTVLVSALTVGALTLVFTLLFSERDAKSAIAGAGLIGGLGTFYLCAGLRFDFRSDLEQMETIKSWPVRPSSIFLATILPEVVLVSGVLSAAILIRALATQNFHPALIGIVALLPVATLAWVALDNAVFLFAPVRYVPGQEGALHHMGRSLVLMLLRMLLLAVSIGLAAGPAIGIWFLGIEVLDVSRALSATLAGLAAWTILLGVDLVLVWVGGRAFRRFDVGRLTL